MLTIFIGSQLPVEATTTETNFEEPEEATTISGERTRYNQHSLLTIRLIIFVSDLSKGIHSLHQLKFSACFLFTFTALPWDAFTRAQTIDTDNILERFRVAKNGDCLLLPVTINNEQYLFLLDTGASRTFIDRAMLPAKPKRRGNLRDDVAGKIIEMEVFDPPAAKLGSFDLRDSVKEVCAHDFSMIRRTSGHEIRGIVGMDFLRKQVVHIDLDRGEVVFLKKANPRSFGDAIPIGYDETQRPQLRLNLPGLARIPFVLDSGDCGLGTGSVDDATSDKFIYKHNFAVAGTTLIESLSGTHRVMLIQGKEAGLERFIFDVSGANSLGLGFFCRYKITFDFPNNRVFLHKSQNFERSDKTDRSGLELLRAENGAEVRSVDQGSTAQKMGIVAGDIVQMIGDLDVKKTSMHDLRVALAEPDKSVLVTILRDGKQIRISLVLK